MTANLIKTLIPNLPRYAEEEGDFYSVTREDLINLLFQQLKIDRAIAENTLDLVENLLDTLCVLNPDYLQKGEWCFVSFPAQLMATSVLTALGNNESRLFAPGFWNTQGISNDKKDQQREVLHSIENARNNHHASRNAQPIRYIYVAWGIIKLDGKILFFQREDTKKRHEKSAGDYGLIGGRANQCDVSGLDKNTLLKELQSPNSDLIKKALPETLKRELREEAGLLHESHYAFKSWRTLKPYRQVQGSAPNHALTEYYLDIFQVELTLDGYLFLQQKIKSDERIVWFSIGEMMSGKTSDGKMAFLQALYKHFADDLKALEAELMVLPDSFASHYFQPTKYGVTFPIDHQKSIFAGVKGKEKALDIMVNQQQLALLLGLASHLRGFEFASFEGAIIFQPFGWIEVKDNPALQSELISLAGLFKDTDLKIESHRDIFFRLSITPDVVFFDNNLFLFTVRQTDLDAIETKIPVTIHRNAFDTAFGKIKAKTEEFKLTKKFANKLSSLLGDEFSVVNEEAIKIEDNYKKELHINPKFLALGLRGLIRQEAGMIKFVVPYAIT